MSSHVYGKTLFSFATDTFLSTATETIQFLLRNVDKFQQITQHSLVKVNIKRPAFCLCLPAPNFDLAWI